MPKIRKSKSNNNASLPNANSGVCPNCKKYFSKLKKHYQKNPICSRASVNPSQSSNDPSFMFNLGRKKASNKVNDNLKCQKEREEINKHLHESSSSLTNQQIRHVTEKVLANDHPDTNTFDHFNTDDMDDNVLYQPSMFDTTYSRNMTKSQRHSYLQKCLEPYVNTF